MHHNYAAVCAPPRCFLLILLSVMYLYRFGDACRQLANVKKTRLCLLPVRVNPTILVLDRRRKFWMGKIPGGTNHESSSTSPYFCRGQ
ncbi:hypothetical protein BCR43DRAFT_486493 [Syncephalastrum racemosum]|uniref:Uncharacterized protein n=1 Tax=Syncephalastrum racemosum TaxID=13706 RepID=A0A1X2HPB6_SYNRA|nr:hypothetical protein BCR43DRAFT_486493 [Syncephalastrum racemosum]